VVGGIFVLCGIVLHVCLCITPAVESHLYSVIYEIMNDANCDLRSGTQPEIVWWGFGEAESIFMHFSLFLHERIPFGEDTNLGTPS